MTASHLSDVAAVVAVAKNRTPNNPRRQIPKPIVNGLVQGKICSKTMVFTPKTMVFTCRISLKPILGNSVVYWFSDLLWPTSLFTDPLKALQQPNLHALMASSTKPKHLAISKRGDQPVGLTHDLGREIPSSFGGHQAPAQRREHQQCRQPQIHRAARLLRRSAQRGVEPPRPGAGRTVRRPAEKTGDSKDPQVDSECTLIHFQN